MSLIIQSSNYKRANSNNKDINSDYNQNGSNSNNQLLEEKRTCGTSQSIKL